MPGDSLGPGDLLPPAGSPDAEAEHAALRAHARVLAGMAAYNAMLDAERAIDRARELAQRPAPPGRTP